jgi:D-alanyl-D-alanine carboxypeptidase/D-alanyl-D-alanine carboxypeptidase (penicillin-binding protein 5/6)
MNLQSLFYQVLKFSLIITESPHGLDHEQHYTTAFDLAKIAAHSLENEIFFEIASTQNRVIYPKTENGSDLAEGARYLRNHNKMLRLYKDAIGGKTGFTKRSGRCLVSAAERGGTRLVAVTLNASDDWNDHREMLDFGFANYHGVELCKEGEFTFDINVVNGINADIVKCENISAETASVPMHITRDDITVRVEIPRFVYAPVKKGDIIGRVLFLHGENENNALIGYSIITASEEVEGIPLKKSFIDRIREFFEKN